MKRLSLLICLLFLCGSFLVAQETSTTSPTTEPPSEETPVTEENTEISDVEGTPPQDTTEDTTEDSGESSSPESIGTDDYIEDEQFVYKMNQRGDQFIKIGLMVNIPFKPKMSQLYVGGSGTLGYMHFFNSNFALGGDVSFAYMATIGDNIFTYIPLMVKAMYQFSFHKFEIPIILGIGGAFENYNSDMYFGLIIKPEVGFFYRHSPSWSFGINVGLNMMPQWSKKKSYFGLIMDTGITVRYHF